ncbi:hypothetical protein [Streptomyces brevispora]|uniref:Uncharacterized protein n=1 Tax=Streptomyces brevispora TaxID=887462 RepID=A0ABZ1FX51_9ACTN|nr:hypothetical protein [Streptomyces brevispora]WSC12184.1 hypothetical protein OIE64_04545 [Streptomyces brevispora]
MSAPEAAVDPAAGVSALHALLRAGDAGGDAVTKRLANLVDDGGFAVRVGALSVRVVALPAG